MCWRHAVTSMCVDVYFKLHLDISKPGHFTEIIRVTGFLLICLQFFKKTSVTVGNQLLPSFLT